MEDGTGCGFQRNEDGTERDGAGFLEEKAAGTVLDGDFQRVSPGGRGGGYAGDFGVRARMRRKTSLMLLIAMVTLF
ncbi:MAG: hypothetical protein LBL45_03780 [Treponema sp.]|nr:hypothetical protein [Treponema sp.]